MKQETVSLPKPKSDKNDTKDVAASTKPPADASGAVDEPDLLDAQHADNVRAA